MSIRKFILTTAAAGGLAFSGAGTADASSNGETPKSVLDELCEERGGSPIYSPYAIARCERARANKGFETERLICENLADGRFVASPSTMHMNRATWACIATSPVT
jgi:hypothetical protein